ncbi:protein of unknown function [Magnetospirillum gryphiswaldense MSR-1 v2]|uniref:Uncharacterized protein n=1 Tax=Magnetospirillum gryphiswaldense (strain DSM 6361 / JCM 21280 / NBRC 15271 / MSR-1) TaxID=431944 RepID=V6F759_MAGGM|nr:hypothetical protein [Magnetospirillum gryphiswaldense]CDL01212.1 protein of unknown function [Magnetospirillum gryphiswaldense MSR-1 v2]
MAGPSLGGSVGEQLGQRVIVTGDAVQARPQFGPLAQTIATLAQMLNFGGNNRIKFGQRILPAWTYPAHSTPP